MKKKFARAFYCGYLAVALPLLFALYGILTACTFLLPIKYRKIIIAASGKIFAYLILHYLCFAKCRLIDRRQPHPSVAPTRGALYIANHLSLLDIPLTACTHPITPLMKKEILYIPVINLAAIAMEAIVVDRHDPYSRKKALQESMQRIRQKKSLFYYPEGTRSKTKSPRSFDAIHPRLLEFAFSQQVPVTPISLFGTDELMPPKSLPIPGKKIAMITHPVVYPEDFASAQEFAQYCWAQVTSGVHELLNDN